MGYRELANLIEVHKLEIGQLIAKEALQRGLSTYNHEAETQLSQRVLPTVEMIGRYLMSNDPKEYRDYVWELALQRFSQGYSADDFYVMGELLTIAVKQLVAREFPEPSQAKEREQYNRRLESIQVLAHATIGSARLRFNQKPS